MSLPRLILPDSEKETVEAGVLGVGLWKRLVAQLKLLGGGSRKQVIEHKGFEVTVEAVRQGEQDLGRVRVGAPVRADFLGWNLGRSSAAFYRGKDKVNVSTSSTLIPGGHGGVLIERAKVVELKDEDGRDVTHISYRFMGHKGWVDLSCPIKGDEELRLLTTKNAAENYFPFYVSDVVGWAVIVISDISTHVLITKNGVARIRVRKETTDGAADGDDLARINSRFVSKNRLAVVTNRYYRTPGKYIVMADIFEITQTGLGASWFYIWILNTSMRVSFAHANKWNGRIADMRVYEEQSTYSLIPGIAMAPLGNYAGFFPSVSGLNNLHHAIDIAVPSAKQLRMCEGLASNVASLGESVVGVSPGSNALGLVAAYVLNEWSGVQRAVGGYPYAEFRVDVKSSVVFDFFGQKVTPFDVSTGSTLVYTSPVWNNVPDDPVKWRGVYEKRLVAFASCFSFEEVKYAISVFDYFGLDKAWCYFLTSSGRVVDLSGFVPSGRPQTGRPDEFYNLDHRVLYATATDVIIHFAYHKGFEPREVRKYVVLLIKVESGVVETLYGFHNTPIANADILLGITSGCFAVSKRAGVVGLIPQIDSEVSNFRIKARWIRYKGVNVEIEWEGGAAPYLASDDASVQYESPGPSTTDACVFYDRDNGGLFVMYLIYGKNLQGGSARVDVSVTAEGAYRAKGVLLEYDSSGHASYMNDPVGAEYARYSAGSFGHTVLKE